MSFYDQVETQTFEKTALPVGTYGSGKAAGLKILQYIDNPKASRFSDKDPELFMHSFLVAAVSATKEQLEAATKAKSNGSEPNPLLVDTDPPNGTAFYRLNWKEWWSDERVIALACISDKGPDGKPKTIDGPKGPVVVFGSADAVAQLQQMPGPNGANYTKEDITPVVDYLTQKAKEKVVAANTPDDQVESATELQYQNILTQIRIQVHELFKLQDWKGIPRDAKFDPQSLVNTEFGGSVKEGQREGQFEVTVFAKKR